MYKNNGLICIHSIFESQSNPKGIIYSPVVSETKGKIYISSEALNKSDSTGVITVNSLKATTADINGGTIDGATIGAASHTTIKGTTIDATTDFTIGGTVITDNQIADDGTASKEF